MKTYYVKINVEKSFEFDDEIEAADEVDAEEIAKSRVWRGEYQREERACAEITDETYNAEEQEEFHECPVCSAKHSNIDNEEAFNKVDSFYEDELVIHKP